MEGIGRSQLADGFDGTDQLRQPRDIYQRLGVPQVRRVDELLAQATGQVPDLAQSPSQAS